MQKFDIDRFNMARLAQGGEKLVLKRTEYPKPKIEDDSLVDEEGNKIGTKGDMYTKKIMDYILQKGCIDHNPRPQYIDFYEGAKYNEELKYIELEDKTNKEVYPAQKVYPKTNK